MSSTISADPDTETRDILVRPVESSSFTNSPRNKPKPRSGPSGIGLRFQYHPSDDGTDENLLIFLHGLGDTHEPFGKLGKSLRLPQTATLALGAPQQIPYLYEDAFQWYPSFDDLGEPLRDPNPTVGVEAVMAAIQYMVEQCSWPANRIHLFGYAQGGSVGLEVGLRWWKENGSSKALKSIVTINGGMISYPTLKDDKVDETRVLLLKGPAGEDAPVTGEMGWIGRAYLNLKQVQQPHWQMPRNGEEWKSVMVFWSEVIEKRLTGDLYQVLTGV